MFYDYTLFYCFNLPLDNLPNGIKRININNHNYDKKLNSLPNSVEYIKLNDGYKLKIDLFPKNLITIECAWYYKYKNDFLHQK